MERLFDACFREIRVHVGPEAASIGARALACGPNLSFAPGEYRPQTEDGLRLLGHELTHVLQQRVGRARTHGAGESVLLLDAALEAEANAAGARVAAGLPVVLPAGADARRGVSCNGSARWPVQACFYCGDITCLKSEKCKQGVSLGGLFGPGIVSPHVGPHKETQQYSSRGVMESEHMFPAKALKISGTAHNLRNEPTISIPYDMHRGAVSGAGGGISSTGSSHTASGWAAHLGQAAASGNWYQAIRMAAIDGMNGAMMSGLLDEGMTSAYMQVVNGHVMMGRITQQEAGAINNELYNYYLSLKSRGNAK
jgi:hypothetical protein